MEGRARAAESAAALRSVMIPRARAALFLAATLLAGWPRAGDAATAALPPDVVAWQDARGWSEHHARWHAQRRWNLLHAPARDWAARRGWSAAARPEGSAGSGKEFLLMHRAMLQLLRESFPDRAALFAGWTSPPARLLDARMTAAVRRLTEDLDSFPSEDAFGRYLETDLRPRPGAPGALDRDPSAGVHARLHEALADPSSPVDAGDPTVNFRNAAFWALHGWIDARWEAYRRLRGLDDDAASYRADLAAARAHMSHEGAPALEGPVPEEISKGFFRDAPPRRD
jgi:hypothetical protein